MFFGIIVAIIFILAMVITKNTFVSKYAQQVHHQTTKAFQQNNSYGNFRRYVKDADLVLYTDMYNLHRSNNLSPEQVQGVLISY